jgi:hypothetical protein
MKTFSIKIVLSAILFTVLNLRVSADTNDSTAVIIDSITATPNPFCEGGSVQLNVYVSGGSGAYTYEWTSIPPGQTFTIANPVVNPLLTTDYILTINDGLNPPVSDTITVILTTNNVTGGVIGYDQTICEGDDPMPFVEITPASGSGNLTYLWQWSGNPSGPWNYIIGATNAVYNPPALIQTIYYRRITTSTQNNCQTSAFSNVVSIQINFVNGGTIGYDQTICPGSDPPLIMSVNAGSGNWICYQWQMSVYSNGPYTNIPGGVAAEYDPPVLTTSAWFRRITISQLNGVVCQDISNTVAITISGYLPVAAGSINGVTTVCQGQTNVVYTVPPIQFASSYLWTAPIGAIISSGGWSSNTATVSFGPYSSSGMITVRGMNYCGNGPVSSLSVTVHPCSTVSGSLSYDNTAATPMANTGIQLNTSGGTYKSTVTDQGGNFMFNEVFPGNYTVQPVIAKVPGGNNATDAMLSLQEFLNTGTLQGLKLAAADADSSGYVNAVDALLIAKRFVGLISGFPAGDWYSEIVQIQAVQGNNLSAFLKCICIGDVDGSYTPQVQK